jgi:hypothetical protein
MRKLILALSLTLALPALSVAFGNRIVNLKVGALEGGKGPKHGLKILVKKFVDSRKVTSFIGQMRGGFGQPMGNVLLGGRHDLNEVLCMDTADLLTDAGFQVSAETDKDVKPDSAYDAILWGEIKVFWLDMYMKAWHDTRIVLELATPDGKKTLWRQTYEGHKAVTVWVGASGEFERVVNKSYTESMQEAYDDFLSREFLSKVEKAGHSGAADQAEPKPRKKPRE